MIRWYDWLLAVAFADALLTMLIQSATATSLFAQLYFSAALFFVWYSWNIGYCSLRLLMEIRRK